MALRQYPNLRRVLAERHIGYNRLMEYLEKQEREKTGRVLVIRPTMPIIRSAENNRTARAMWDEIRRFTEA